jgi:CDP-diacylglycerol--serine O-phosphatidyltransferase
MTRKIAALPAMVTLGNLVCGFQAIRLASQGNYVIAAWLVLLGMVFDAFDGKVARLTKGASEFGAELDSLADVVTFGVAPAFIVAAMSRDVDLAHQRLVGLACLVYAVCTALRLARFNVETTTDEASHQSFKGMPSPAAAGQIASLVILHEHLGGASVIPRLLPTVAFFAGILMVSNIRYPHMISVLFGGKRSFSDIVYLVIALLLLGSVPEFTLAATFTLFTLLGVARAARHVLSHHDEGEEPLF